MRITRSLWPNVRNYAIITLLIAAITVILLPFGLAFDLANILMLYLLPVLMSSVMWGIKPACYAAALGVLSFDLFFIPPFLSVTVADLRYLISFGVFLLVAGLTAGQAAKLKQQLYISKQREAHTAILYALSKQLSAVTTIDAVIEAVAEQVSSTHNIAIGATIRCIGIDGSEEAAPDKNALPHYDVPLQTDDRLYGVLRFEQQQGNIEFSPEQRRLMDALGGLAASAIARVKLAEEAKIAHLTAESERLRTAVLDSVSHELRTPLATVIGAATGLIESERLLSPADRMELLYTIREGALRMNRLIVNLLHMVQLESGMLRLKNNWCDVEDLIGIALSRVQDFRQQRSIRVELPDEMPMLVGDEMLLEQMVVNVVTNAIKYSPDHSEIVLSAKTDKQWLVIAVADHGISLTKEEYIRIFDKFYRADATRHISGTGLGLAICKGIAELHGGSITAAANAPTGTVVTMTLPLNGRQNEACRISQEGEEQKR